MKVQAFIPCGTNNLPNGIDIQFVQPQPFIRAISHDNSIVEDAEGVGVAQKCDKDLELLDNWLHHNRKTEQTELNLASPTQKFYYLNRDLFFVAGEVIYKKDDDEDKLVVPHSVKNDLIQACHDIPSAGHQGVERTKEYMKQKYYWHHMGRDIKNHVAFCAACNINKAANRKNKHPMMTSHMGAPMERIHVDFMGPFPTSTRGNKYILVLVDNFTKWIEVFPLESQTAELTAKTAVNEFFCRLGYPGQLLTDQGTNFESELFKSMCKLLKIKKKRTTAYRPSANGQAERTNRTLMNAIRCFVDKQQNDWDVYLPQIAAALRSAVNRNTGFTPNRLMLGREVSTPAELMYPGKPLDPSTVEEFIVNLENKMLEAHDTARKTLKVNLKRARNYYNLDQSVVEFREGDVIYLVDKASKKGRAKKLDPIWQGPGVITHRLTPFLFRVRLNKNRKTMVVNHDHLKKAHLGEIPKWISHLQKEIGNNQQDTYCWCKKPDDGLPMVQCDECLIWFHCGCIGMTRNQAYRLEKYICDACSSL